MKFSGLVDGFCVYTRETPFHGFSFAANGWGKCEIIAWLLAILACIAIAIQQTVNLVEQYEAEPTETKVLVNYNKSIQLPTPTLCFPISLGENFSYPSYTIWRDEIKISGSTSGLFSRLENITAKEIYKRESDMVKLMYLVFAEITGREEKVITSGLTPEVKWKLKSSSESYKVFASSKRSIDYLLKLTGALICKLLSVEARFEYMDKRETYLMKTVFFNVCKPELVSHIDKNVLCMKLHTETEKFEFYGPQDTLSISLKIDSWLPPNTTETKFWFDVGGRSHYDAYSDGGNVIAAELKTSTRVATQLMNSFRSLNLKRRACLQDLNSFECQRICAGNHIATCGCWPLYFFDINKANLPFCTGRYPSNLSSMLMPDYNDCARKKEMQSQIPPACFMACTNACYYQQFMLIPEMSGNCLETDLTELKIYIRDFTYSTVVEIVTKDWQSFMCEFGGNIGVWLGGSILACVHVPVYIFKMLYSVTVKKKQNLNKISTQTYY